MKNTHTLSYAAAIAVCTSIATLSWAEKVAEPSSKKEPVKESTKATNKSEESKDTATKAEDKAKSADAKKPVEPKALTDEIRKGLKYLASTQNEDGGWGQGGGWRINTGKGDGGGRVDAKTAQDRSDVGNTCMTMLAFLRAGETLKKGEYKSHLTKGAQFVMNSVEKSDAKDLYVSEVRDTQMQSKIGRYVDTFLALQLLSELKDEMPDKAMEKKRADLAAKIVSKIEQNQKDDGAFAGNGGWASVLSQGLCSRALNGARLKGIEVSDAILEVDNKQNVAGLDVAGKSFSGAAVAGAPSTAGIQLYANSSKLRGLQENWAVNQQRKAEFRKVVASETAKPEDKKAAKEELQKIADADEAQEAALEAVVNNVKDDKFVAGFGNNGGEEFLSYMNISESLRIKGGDDWEEWDKKITATIHKAQNKDGSWSGHHCITGRNFCTSGALLTLMADRAPMPEIKEEVAAAK